MMHAAVKRIIASFHLTARETDVVLGLIDGHVTARDLARHLGLSESTVQNHIDNISSKTGLAGKSELLVHVVQKAFQMLENARFFIATPSVLVLDDHQDLADGITNLFRDRGCRASAAYEVHDSLIERIMEEKIDLIVCDVRLGRHNGIEFLRSLTARIPEVPSLVVISADDEETAARDLAAAWLKKPLDLNVLFDSAVDAIISRERTIGRGERMTLDAKVMVDGKSLARTYEIGTGGMAINSGAHQIATGRTVKFELELPEKTVIRGEGEAVWSAPEDGRDKGPTVGIRFRNIDDDQRLYLNDYVRTKNILKFIPIDRTLVPSAPKKKIG